MENINEGIQKHNCTSCGMCASICPKNAIKIELDKYGFYRPIIEEKKCIHCGICRKMCYKYLDDNTFNDKNIKVYSGYAKNEQLLSKSTSGGIAGILSEKLIDLGYAVVGVSYDYKKNIAISKVARDKKTLEEFKGSKYIQSYTTQAFREIIEDKSNQKYAIFGLPCHIYAFNKYIEHYGKKDKYILIDLFCHGCPTMNLWNKYLKQINNKQKISSFDNINFRSKINGWHEYCVSIQSGEKVYTSTNKDNYFYNLFFSDCILNDSCMDCIFRGTMKYTDIRLGDFWGEEYDKNTKGVSIVVIESEKGKKIFELIKDKIEYKEENIECMFKSQSYGKIYKINTNLRNKLLKDLASKKSNIVEIDKYYRKSLPIKIKIKNSLKNIISLMPKSWKGNLRRVYHKIKR